MSDIEFVPELPRAALKGRRSGWAVVAENLKADPGHWAIVKRATGKPHSHFGGYRAALLRFGCESTTRVIDGELRLYARWPEASAS